MYIQRKPIMKTHPQTQQEYVDGFNYVTSDGRTFSDIRATVNKRPIVADIVQADTEEGWIDVELPEFDTVEEIQAGDCQIDINKKTIIPIFDPKIKRIEGKVKIFGKQIR